MLYHHHFLGGFAVSASGPRRTLSLWGLGAAAGLLSFPLRVRSGDPDPDPLLDGLELAGGSIRSLPARVGSVPRSRVGSSWRSWLVGTALGGVLAACGGGGGGGGSGGGGGNTASNSAPTTTTLATAFLTATEEAEADWDISAWFSDADGDELTFEASLQEKDDATAMALAENHWLMLDEATGALTIEANATDDTEVGVHTLVLTATDGTASATHSLLLTITDDRDGDPVTNANPHTTLEASVTLTAMEEASAEWDVSDWFSDQDAEDTLTFTGTLQKMDASRPTTLADVDWLALDRSTGALTIAANATDDEHVGVYTLVLTASDGMASVTHTVTLVITDDKTDGTVTNAPPVTTTDAPAMLEAMEEASASWNAMAWFTDTDAADTLAFTGTLQKTDENTAAALSEVAWLVLNEATGALTIAASATDDDEVGVYTLVLTASDGMASVTHSLFLTITDDPDDGTVTEANSAPVTTTLAMTSLTAMEGIAADWDVSDWFSDPDTGDTLTYTETGLPDWLELDDTKGELTIAASATDDAQVGSHTFTITASDDDDESVSLKVTLTVENDPEDPTVAAGAPGMLTALEGAAMTWDVSGWFDDPDLAAPGGIDSLTYTATGLPAWLTFASGMLTIAASATDGGDVGVHTLAVTASDKAAAMAVHTATLTVAADRTDPIVSTPLSTRVAPAAEMSLVLDLGDFFTDLQEDNSTAGVLTFEVSDSIDDDTMMDENVITAMIVGGMLVLTPGAASSMPWQQETVTITATDSDGQTLKAEFVVTTPGNVLDTSDLAPAHGFIIQGDMAGDELGQSVSGAGDINGDGLDDLIVGAPKGDDKATRAGEAYIIYGKANLADGAAGTQFGTAETTGTAMRHVVDTTSLVPADGFILQGDRREDTFGDSVSGAGDINGDGLDDLIVGVPLSDDSGRNAAGAAYIIYGKAGTGSPFGTTGSDGRQVLDTTSLKSADGFIIRGNRSSELLGASVAGAGDINGDGLGDLIVGAYVDDCGNAIYGGTAHIVYGKADPTGAGLQFGETMGSRQVLVAADLAPADGFVLEGDTPLDQLGWSVSGAGDINGDGIADLIVGARNGHDGGDDAGEAYIIYGKAVDDDTYFGTAMTIVVNESDPSSPETRTISEGEDVPPGFVESEVVIDNLLDVTDLKPADGFILQGDRGDDELAFSVSGAGDINGDGFDDLIAGAWKGDDGMGNAGEAYIIYGKANPADEAKAGTQFGTTKEDGAMRQVLDTSTLAPAAGFIIQGDTGGDQLGISVSGAGDVNGDGLADLIVGTNGSDDGGDKAGEAYILYGKAGTDGTQFGTAVRINADGDPIASDATPEGWVDRQVLDTTGLAQTDGFILRGDMAGDELGRSVSGAGDVNGDGFDDLIAGAYQGDDGGGNAGEAYVVYGGAHLGEVVSHAQTLVGMAVPTLAGDATDAAKEAAARAPFLLGGAGDDTLTAHADTTVLYGGAGDDVLVLADDSFRRVDGGSGDDRLVLGTSLTLDFTEASDRGRVRGIETLSLSDATAEVTLNLLSVYALVESRNNGGEHTSAGEAFLRLEGVGMVVLEGGTWTPTPAEGPDLYVQGSAKLLIDDGLVAA